MDETPWMYFRQVLARFDPDNQYAVTMKVKNSEQYHDTIYLTDAASIISQPSLGHFPQGEYWESDTARIVIRAYKWQDEYYIDWTHRCAEDAIEKIEKLEIPDNGTL